MIDMISQHELMTSQRNPSKINSGNTNADINALHLALIAAHNRLSLDSPNRSTVVLAICGASASLLNLLGHRGHPPNRMTSHNPGDTPKAVAL